MRVCTSLKYDVIHERCANSIVIREFRNCRDAACVQPNPPHATSKGMLKEAGL
jgi:hypothetical protein